MKITLSEAAETFLNSHRHVPATYRTYKRDIDRLLDYMGHELLVQQVTVFDLERAVQRYEQRAGVNSIYTVNKFIKTMRTFFNRCVKYDLIANAPSKHVIYRSEPDVNTAEKAMPVTAFERLVDFYAALAKHKPKQYTRALTLVLFFETGARRGGAAGLKWSQVDFANKVAMVTEKGQKIRRVYLGKLLLKALAEWRLIQNASAGDTVFGKNGAVITSAALGQYFRRRCIEAGVGSWGTHSLRHMKGHQLEAAGVADHIAADIMGHSVETYRKYYVRKGDGVTRETALHFTYGERSNILKRDKKMLGN